MSDAEFDAATRAAIAASLHEAAPRGGAAGERAPGGAPGGAAVAANAAAASPPRDWQPAGAAAGDKKKKRNRKQRYKENLVRARGLHGAPHPARCRRVRLIGMLMPPGVGTPQVRPPGAPGRGAAGAGSAERRGGARRRAHMPAAGGVALAHASCQQWRLCCCTGLNRVAEVAAAALLFARSAVLARFNPKPATLSLNSCAMQEKEKEPAPRAQMRIVSYYGDWVCECGQQNRLWDTCACGQSGPCRDWVRGRCKYAAACRFSHPPFELPAGPAPSSPIARPSAEAQLLGGAGRPRAAAPAADARPPERAAGAAAKAGAPAPRAAAPAPDSAAAAAAAAAPPPPPPPPPPPQQRLPPPPPLPPPVRVPTPALAPAAEPAAAPRLPPPPPLPPTQASAPPAPAAAAAWDAWAAQPARAPAAAAPSPPPPPPPPPPPLQPQPQPQPAPPAPPAEAPAGGRAEAPREDLVVAPPRRTASSSCLGAGAPESAPAEAGGAPQAAPLWSQMGGWGGGGAAAAAAAAGGAAGAEAGAPPGANPNPSPFNPFGEHPLHRALARDYQRDPVVPQPQRPPPSGGGLGGGGLGARGEAGDALGHARASFDGDAGGPDVTSLVSMLLAGGSGGGGGGGAPSAKHGAGKPGAPGAGAAFGSGGYGGGAFAALGGGAAAAAPDLAALSQALAAQGGTPASGQWGAGLGLPRGAPLGAALRGAGAPPAGLHGGGGMPAGLAQGGGMPLGLWPGMARERLGHAGSAGADAGGFVGRSLEAAMASLGMGGLDGAMQRSASAGAALARPPAVRGVACCRRPPPSVPLWAGAQQGPHRCAAKRPGRGPACRSRRLPLDGTSAPTAVSARSRVHRVRRTWRTSCALTEFHWQVCASRCQVQRGPSPVPSQGGRRGAQGCSRRRRRRWRARAAGRRRSRRRAAAWRPRARTAARPRCCPCWRPRCGTCRACATGCSPSRRARASVPRPW